MTEEEGLVEGRQRRGRGELEAVRRPSRRLIQERGAHRASVAGDISELMVRTAYYGFYDIAIMISHMSIYFCV
jgi:hypothetical protein